MSDARLWVIHAIACGEISCRHIIFCGRFIGARHFQSFTSGLQEQMTGGQPHRRCSLNYIVRFWAFPRLHDINLRCQNRSTSWSTWITLWNM